jgi:arginine utilization protein RocB
VKPTTVRTSDLLDKLQENRAKHVKEYKKARKTWLKKAIKELRKVANQAEKTKRLNNQSFSPLQRLPKPVSYAHSYDVMIARLEAEVNDQVELDERDFNAYWLDNWEWSGAFVGTTSLYNG